MLIDVSSDVRYASQCSRSSINTSTKNELNKLKYFKKVLFFYVFRHKVPFSGILRDERNTNPAF